MTKPARIGVSSGSVTCWTRLELPSRSLSDTRWATLGGCTWIGLPRRVSVGSSCWARKRRFRFGCWAHRGGCVDHPAARTSASALLRAVGRRGIDDQRSSRVGIPWLPWATTRWQAEPYGSSVGLALLSRAGFRRDAQTGTQTSANSECRCCCGKGWPRGSKAVARRMEKVIPNAELQVVPGGHPWLGEANMLAPALLAGTGCSVFRALVPRTFTAVHLYGLRTRFAFRDSVTRASRCTRVVIVSVFFGQA